MGKIMTNYLESVVTTIMDKLLSLDILDITVILIMIGLAGQLVSTVLMLTGTNKSDRG